jgi:hypothetical protein
MHVSIKKLPHPVHGLVKRFVGKTNPSRKSFYFYGLETMG